MGTVPVALACMEGRQRSAMTGPRPCPLAFAVTGRSTTATFFAAAVTPPVRFLSLCYQPR